MFNLLKTDPSLSTLIDSEEYSISIREPVIVRVNAFTESSVRHFTEDMAKAHETKQNIIPVVCDSYGGQVYALLAMIDVINSAKVPVATIIEGKAMSCGAIFASCGTKGYRYIGENATVMIHDVSSGTLGKISEMQVRVDEAKRLNKIAFDLLDKNAIKKKNYFWNILQEKSRADWFITPRDAKKYGLVDHVGIPEFVTKVKVSQKLVLKKR